MTKDPEIGFQLLCNSLRLAISLRMMDSGESNIIEKEMSEFLHKGKGKLGATIRDNFVICLKKRVAILTVSMNLVQEMKITPFVGPWLTMTRTELIPEKTRRSVIIL